jgi:hypothetical protein
MRHIECKRFNAVILSASGLIGLGDYPNANLHKYLGVGGVSDLSSAVADADLALHHKSLRFATDRDRRSLPLDEL